MIPKESGIQASISNKNFEKLSRIRTFINKLPFRYEINMPPKLLGITLGLITLHFALSPIAAENHKPAPEKFIARSWNTVSGLPHNNVRALAQTGDGYMWLGTPAGLVRFDGVRFVAFNQWNTPILKTSRILSLYYEDINSVLWIGTDGGGLYTCKEGEWRYIGEQNRHMNGHIRAVTRDLKGNIWIGTEYGLHRLAGEEMNVYGLEEGLSDNLITALEADSSGRLWAGTMWGGLARFEEGLVQMYDSDDGLLDLTVLSLSAGTADGIWIGTMSGLFHLRPDEGLVRPVAKTSGYPVTSLARGPDEGLLVGTMVEGLKILDNSSLEDLPPTNGLSNSHIHATFLGRDGYIWIGTESSGLVQLKERKVGAITAGEGLPEGSVYALLEDNDGTLWIGTENSGLFRMRGGRITAVSNRSKGLAGDMVRALLRDRSGGIWAGTMDGGLSILTHGRIENLTNEEGLASDNVTVILQDKSGVVWIGTDRGLSRYGDGVIENGGAAAALDGQAIRTLFENKNGMLYAGTRRGIWKLSGASFEKIDADYENLEFDALSLYEDDDGGRWIGTNGDGLKHLSKRKITTYTTRDGLPGNFIYSISAADSALLWISCEAGVFSISRDSINAYAGHDIPILVPTLYDDTEGMPSARCSGFCNPAVCESSSGNRYYPTKEGIAVFEREYKQESSNPPVVRIESILADEIPLGEAGGSELPHNTDRIEIRFTAFDYSAPGKCRFLYRLEGSDTGFTSLHPHQRRTALYRHLPPGEYEFSVRAVGNSGLWSESAAVARFSIVPPFYRKRAFPFILMAGIIIAGSAAAASSRYRKNRKRKMKYSTTTIDTERMEKALTELNTLMEDEKIFLDPDLTLEKLARRLKIHYNHLSRIINERFEMSFNNYINRFRIKEAQKRLTDPAEASKNILDIMLDVGFYSKSTFNTAFKKFTGTSPSKYRKKHS